MSNYIGLVNKLWYIHTTEYCPATKNNNAEQCSTTWKDNTKQEDTKNCRVEYSISIKNQCAPLYVHRIKRLKEFIRTVVTTSQWFDYKWFLFVLCLSVPKPTPSPNVQAMCWIFFEINFSIIITFLTKARRTLKKKNGWGPFTCSVSMDSQTNRI